MRAQSLPLWGGAPRSELKSNNCQWQLLHNVKVARASPASARRMRATCLSLWERCPKGAGRAIFTLSVGSAASSPRVGAKGERGRTRENEGERGKTRENGLPHQSADWFAMTCVVRGLAERTGFNLIRPTGTFPVGEGFGQLFHCFPGNSEFSISFSKKL